MIAKELQTVLSKDGKPLYSPKITRLPNQDDIGLERLRTQFNKQEKN